MSSVTLDGISTGTINAFFLVLTRLGAIMVLAPLWSGTTIPTRVKAVFAIVLTLVTLPVVMPSATQLADIQASRMVLLLFKEVAVGFAIGFAAGAVVIIWQMAAALLDTLIGFSYGGVVDPFSGNQTPILQQIYGLLAIMIFITIGGEQWLIGALVKSYEMVPLTGSVPINDLVEMATKVMGQIFFISMGVAAPVLIALLVTDIAFGLVARAAPQTQIFQLEAPVKITVGLLVIIACLPFMGGVLETALKRVLGPSLGVF